MKRRIFSQLTTVAGIVVTALFILSLPAKGQFPADSTLPRDKRTKREIAAFAPGPTPRTADGKPDLSGVWGYAGYTSDVAKDYDVGSVPMTELGEKLFKERQTNQGIYDPEARCLPTGVPRRDPYPSKILQEPTWFGDSIGKWEGDELVVDTTGFNGKTWLDLAGHPTSEQLHVIERYSRPQFGELKLDITIEDPVMYKKPLKVTELMPLMAGADLIEYVCGENERDVRHLVPGEK